MPIIYERETISQRLEPNDTQRATLYVIGAYFIGILILWNLPYIKHILYPFKLLVVGLHEFSHATAGCCTGARIEAIEIEPNEGGVTRMRGGVQCCTLPAGYLGSSLIGALLIFCGFDILASKIAAILLGLCLIAVLFWARNWLTRGITVFFIGLIVVLWIVKDSAGLKYFVLFVGVMSCFYSVWDIMDDLVMRKVNESDASKFAQMCGCCPSQVWGFIWLIISILFLLASVVAGILAFKQDNAEQKQAADHFLKM
ncbi:2123_t:CDS:2 [Paraglomus occultum]|uniref:2123_t:CDS:1 n=1 Tax=Paraglomus occultum TaxID=144539 RepID=A0A9N9C2Y5_9GLOM|nr:2123_t:CDS:2 [Paraglomus occultum]